MKTLYGVFGAVGRWPDWQRFFDPSKAGLIRSALALLICFPSLWLVMVGLETERARIGGTEVPNFQLFPFLLIISAWLLSFPITSGVIVTLMGRREALPLWWVSRHWAVSWLCLALGLVFLTVVYLGVPTMIGYGALLAAYLGLLPIDIRLAQRAAGFPFMTAILVGCVIVSTGMMIMLFGLLQVIQPT